MNLDPTLLDLLACPACHAPLRTGTEEDPAADVLSCTGCGLRYPVRDDIPVLLVDEVTPGPAGAGSAMPGGDAAPGA